MKPYDVGLICGRFQTFHKGHEKLVDTALTLCDRVLILVGSAQESGTERNPFNIATRIKMIKEIYGDEVMVYGLSDLTNENDITPEWGKYLLDNARRYIHKNPDIMIYGNDESRSKWFNKEDLANTAELIINRNELPVSGTMCRDLMTLGHQEEWMKLVNPRLHKMWEELCDELYQNRLDEICELLKENEETKLIRTLYSREEVPKIRPVRVVVGDEILTIDPAEEIIEESGVDKPILDIETYNAFRKVIDRLVEKYGAAKVTTDTSGKVVVEPANKEETCNELREIFNKIPKEAMMGDSENTCRVNLNEGHALPTDIPIKECGGRKGREKIKLRVNGDLIK